MPAIDRIVRSEDWLGDTVRDILRRLDGLESVYVRGDDGRVYSGWAVVGPWPGNTEFAMFANRAVASIPSAYGVLQSKAGDTYVNAGAGRTVFVRVADQDRLVVSNAGLTSRDAVRARVYYDGSGTVIVSPDGTRYVQAADAVTQAVASTSGPALDVKNQGSGGTQATQVALRVVSAAADPFSAIALFAGAASPIIGCYEQSGEVVQFLNGANTGWVPLWASAYVVRSDVRAKIEVEDARKDSLLRRAARLRLIRYRDAARPVLSGESHDCAGTGCVGTPESPCLVGRNDGPRFGVDAGQVADLIPEVAQEVMPPGGGVDGPLLGVDVSQAAPMALALVGRLYELLLAAEARVASLEARVASLEGDGR